MADDNLAPTNESRFGAAIDDVIIIPLVFIALAANKSLRFVFLILIQLFYVFPLAMQIIWLPLFAAKLLGDVIVAVVNGGLRFAPLSEARR